jgi:hypothetical protein
MARIDNLNAHTKKTHGGLTWQEAEAVARSALAAQQQQQQIPPTLLEEETAHAHHHHHHQALTYEMSAVGDSGGVVAHGSCLELKTIDCFKPLGSGHHSGVVLLGGSGHHGDEFKIMCSPPSPADGGGGGSWMT